MKRIAFLLLIWCMLTHQSSVFAQPFNPGAGNTVLLIGQTFQNEYQGYKSGTGLTPAGGSHYGTLYLGTIEQGDDNPNSAFLDWIRNQQSNPYALVALSIKDNTRAGGYGQMINPAWGEFNSNAIWEACRDIKNGKWNNKIDEFADIFASRPDVKFYLRIGYEVSLFLFAYKGEQYCNDWLDEQANAGINVFDNPDAVSEMDRQAYISAYNHIARRIRQKASNVAFVYHPVRGYNDTKWLYPGNQNVDYVGFSIFNNDVCLEVNGTFNCQGKRIDPELQKSMNFAKSNGKPIIIAESAVQAPASNSASGFNDYLNRLHDVVVSNDVRVLAYINSDWPSHGWDANWGDSRVEVNSSVRNHWKQKFGSGTRYLHSGSSVQEPTCTDGIQNGNETGVDCGGSCPPCSNNPTCNDGIKNGNETGVDCGGSCPPCQSNNCPPSHPYECGGRCYVDAAQAAAGGCTKSGVVRTEEETIRVTCPASHPYECGGRCYVDAAQAESAGCTNTSPTCNDGIQNQGETGVDCGGPCPACNATPTCNDGIQNQGETGVDCGGPCPACNTSPTCNDGIQNQGETGIDCGGPCPACGNGNDPLSGAKLLPPGKKILLSIGQDLKTEQDYINGGVNQKGFPVPGAVVSYNSFHTLEEPTYPQYGALGEAPDGTPYNNDVNWGAGPLNARNAADGYPESALVIALNIADGGDPGDVWCSGCISQIGGGAYDTEIKALAAFCKRRPNEPIYLRIGFEFDGKWNLGYSNTGAFKSAWRRIVDVMRGEGVNNVAYVWQSCASPIDDILEKKHENIQDWWPGDNYVDWLGLSWFMLPGEKPLVSGYDPHTQKQLADEVVSLARSKKKPVMIAESTPQGYDLTELKNCHMSPIWDGDAATGCVSKSAGQIWNEWFVPYFDYIYANKDVIRHVTYINVNWEDDTDKFGPGSNYAEGYWGRAGVHVNNTIANNWKTEITKSVWMHGGTNNNSGSLKSTRNNLTVHIPVSGHDDLRAYPNPVENILHIEGFKKNTRISIYSVDGTKVLEQKAQELIDVSGLKPGMYFIQTTENQRTSFVK